jgi:hypothetical protein
VHIGFRRGLDGPNRRSDSSEETARLIITVAPVLSGKDVGGVSAPAQGLLLIANNVATGLQVTRTAIAQRWGFKLRTYHLQGTKPLTQKIGCDQLCRDR